jgi:hypothetical protein
MTTLAEFADALAAKLSAKLPDVPVVSVDAPPQTQRRLQLPAVYLLIADFEPLTEAGDSRLLVDARWEALCIFDPNAERPDLGLRALAARVAVALHEIRRPVAGQGHIRLARAGENYFRPEMDGYLSWVVEFAVEIALGELDPEGIAPSEIYIGNSPAIGENHVDDYEKIV